MNIPQRVNRFRLLMLAVGLLAAIQTTQSAFAEETDKRIEEEKRGKLAHTEESIAKNNQKLAWDFGGWINFLYLDYNEDDKNRLLSDLTDYATYLDLRLWFKATLDVSADALTRRRHSLYVRVKDLHVNRTPKATAGGSDHEGPHLDYAYAQLDFDPAWVKIGRQYFTVGQGIAVGDVGDGAQVQYSFPRWNIKTFFNHNIPQQENIDLSVPGYDKRSDRYFLGIECSFTELESHNLYSFAVAQKDYSNERPDDPAHQFSYDSEYYGVGARGSFPNKISYWLEGMREEGKSFIYESGEEAKVSAWAGALALAFEPTIATHPMFFFKYAYGSGDGDRISVTDTLNGNRSGKDRNFLYFGYVPTGYALAPRLSNLYFYKTGFTAKPLESVEALKNLSIGIDYYRYYKAKRDGGIYDIEATEGNAD
ncbi:MAG: alginate export family protein, partial [Candidatus Omnitrophica bacterium]|nr:alginate export family protein [Candidatus Omnitrophota bacterium]